MAAEGAARPRRHVTGRQDGCLPLVRLWEARAGAPGAACPPPEEGVALLPAPRGRWGGPAGSGSGLRGGGGFPRLCEGSRRPRRPSQPGGGRGAEAGAARRAPGRAGGGSRPAGRGCGAGEASPSGSESARRRWGGDGGLGAARPEGTGTSASGGREPGPRWRGPAVRRFSWRPSGVNVETQVGHARRWFYVKPPGVPGRRYSPAPCCVGAPPPERPRGAGPAAGPCGRAARGPPRQPGRERAAAPHTGGVRCALTRQERCCRAAGLRLGSIPLLGFGRCASSSVRGEAAAGGGRRVRRGRAVSLRDRPSGRWRLPRSSPGKTKTSHGEVRFAGTPQLL